MEFKETSKEPKGRADRRRIVYIQYTNPAGYPPLEHSSRILASAGWHVRFLGIEAAGKASQLVFPEHERIQTRLWSHPPAGVRQKLHYFAFVLWCLWICLRWRPRWVYTSDVFAYPIGLLLALLGQRVVLHEHDTPSPRNTFLKALMWCRAKLARRAGVCVIPQADRAAKFRVEVTPKRVEVVWNCPAVEEVQANRTRISPGLTIWFHGSIVPDQLPRSAILALAELPNDVRLRFAGYETIGHAGYVAELLRTAESIGAGSRVEYMGTPPKRQELYQMMAECDVGLALFARQFREPMAGASNKPFDYLACGLALMLPDTAEWEDIYVAGGYGRSCDPADPHAIAKVLRWYYDRPDETRQMGEAGRRRIQTDWNYENQFEPVKRLLEQ